MRTSIGWLLAVVACGGDEGSDTGAAPKDETLTVSDGDTDTDTDEDTDDDPDGDTSDTGTDPEDSTTWWTWGDSGYVDGSDVEDPDTGRDTAAPSPVVQIDEATVDCSGDEVTFSVLTAGGVASEAVWFAQETGNAVPTQWADEHRLEVLAEDPAGDWSVLLRTLADGSTLADPISDWQTDVSTVFDCDTHYDVPNVMTYAVALLDAQGVPTDCVVLGHDPLALVGAWYGAVASPSFDLAPCALWL